MINDKTKLKEPPDVVLSIFCLIIFPILSGLLLYTKGIVYAIISLLLVLPPMVWLFVRWTGNAQTAMQLDSGFNPKKVFVLFMIFISISVLLFRFRSEIYNRPLMFFVTYSIACGLVALQIVSFDKINGSSTAVVLFEIVLVGLLIRYTTTLLFPGIILADGWVHRNLVQHISKTGHIMTGRRYTHFPLYHVITAQIMAVLGVKYKIATLFSVSTVQTVLFSLIMYKISYRIVDKKPALLASLLVVTSSYVISNSLGPVASSFAAFFIPLIVYLVFQAETGGIDHHKKLLLLLFVAALTVSHTVAPLFGFITLVILWVLFKTKPFVESLLHSSAPKQLYRSDRAHTYLLLLAWTGLAFWWTFKSRTATEFVTLLLIGFSSNYFGTTTSQTNVHVPIAERIIVQMGTIIFIILTTVGLFYMIYNYIRDDLYESVAYALGSASIFAVGVLMFLSGSASMINRWLYFSQILLSVPFAIGLSVIVSMYRKQLGTSFLIFLLVTSTVFFMSMSPRVSTDYDGLSEQSQLKRHFDESEIEAVGYFDSYNEELVKNVKIDQIIISDFSYMVNPSSSLLRNIHGNEQVSRQATNLGYYLKVVGDIDGEIRSKNVYSPEEMKEAGNLIVLRDYVIENEVVRLNTASAGQNAIAYDVPKTIKSRFENNENRIYDSGTVTGYITT